MVRLLPSGKRLMRSGLMKMSKLSPSGGKWVIRNIHGAVTSIWNCVDSYDKHMYNLMSRESIQSTFNKRSIFDHDMADYVDWRLVKDNYNYIQRLKKEV